MVKRGEQNESALATPHDTHTQSTHFGIANIVGHAMFGASEGLHGAIRELFLLRRGLGYPRTAWQRCGNQPPLLAVVVS